MNVRWWWLGPNFRTWTDAEWKAFFLLVIGFGIIATSLSVLLDRGLDLVLRNRPSWVELPGALAIIILSGYLSSWGCRKLWPTLMTTAETSYTKTIAKLQKQQQAKKR